MHTIYIIVDTSVFHKFNYNFDIKNNEILSTLYKRCLDGGIKMLISSVVLSECEKHIIERNNSIKQGLKKLSSIITVDVDSIYNDIMSNIEIKEKGDFKLFLDKMQCEIITTDSVDVNKVMYNYFNKISPFKEGKKHEFPDAIAIESIKNYINQSVVEVFYIISSDSDWAKSFQDLDRCFVLESFNEAIAILYKKHHDEMQQYNEIKDKVWEVFHDCKIELYNKIKDKIYEQGIYLEDCDGDIDVVDSSINDMQFEIMSQEHENIVVNMQIDTGLTIVGEYLDEENSIWDKEDHKYLLKENIEINNDYEYEINCVVSFNVKERAFEVLSVNDSKPLNFYIR